MESAVNGYLHKKFKKQLSLEPRKGENGIRTAVSSSSSTTTTAIATQNEEKKSMEGGAADDVVAAAAVTITVPNAISTNRSNDSVRNDSLNHKSSISILRNDHLFESQSSSNISYVPNIHRHQVNFDTKFSCSDVIRSSSPSDRQKSSILDDSSTSFVKYNEVESPPPPPLPTLEEREQKHVEKAPISAGKYVCTYCNLACAKPSVLQKHIRAHTNERPFPCVSCGFRFKTRSNLYKHCRSRTHANRVLGSKARGEVGVIGDDEHPNHYEFGDSEPKSKLYKPRFHTTYDQLAKENIDDEQGTNSDILSHHINELITKNHARANDTYLKRQEEFNSEHANHPQQRILLRDESAIRLADEPLNLTSKGRKRCVSEAVVESKSLIKELLLKNLSSDMQCPHCKMIFQTVTELELHKLRSCKGFVQPGAKYTRSSSVNVASILTQNKNAFDNIPQMHSFPMKSPGPFLGKTRLVEADKSKSFSFDEDLPNVALYHAGIADRQSFGDKYLLSPLAEKKTAPVKLFGGQVKISDESGTGEATSQCGENFETSPSSFMNYKMSENRVIKSSLHSGGTVLTNKGTFGADSLRTYDATTSNVNSFGDNDRKRPPDLVLSTSSPPSTSVDDYNKYSNIIDFSQNAMKLLTPNLKQPNLLVPGVPVPNRFTYSTSPQEHLVRPLKIEIGTDSSPRPIGREKFQFSPVEGLYNPMNILVNGKVVRYVPGMPGPIINESPASPKRAPPPIFNKVEADSDHSAKATQLTPPEPRPPVIKTSAVPPDAEPKKFARPNSLALKPTSACLKQHHGLTPTMFNQILISPETPRVAKKYVQQYLNGTYFSYLGLKSTTRPVYCTLNKTQPFYVPHFKKLSMYSEWRQQDMKADKLYVVAYDSRQRPSRYTLAGQKTNYLTAHSSYKYNAAESVKEKDEGQRSGSILGGYECNDDYTYIRGRGRGRYVCEQCGIRCKKPSMLKKHIRTHSNDRPYTCSHCNFSFKTKGNLTKHMKSKAHTKNSTTGSSGSSTHQSGTPSSESETDDSGMDSSDESTRQQEHEAAYGLLSLSQKSTHDIATFNTYSSRLSNCTTSPEPVQNTVMNPEEIAYVTQTNYAKNKFLEQPAVLKVSNIREMASKSGESTDVASFFGNRPLTYPYATSEPFIEEPEYAPEPPKCIKQFHVIQRYASGDKEYVLEEIMPQQQQQPQPQQQPTVIVAQKRKLSENEDYQPKRVDEVIDLSLNNNAQKIVEPTTPEFDNSAMETLADVATKQVKLEKNAMAKSVASEYLKLATNRDFPTGDTERFQTISNDLIVKSEGSKSCSICSKSFNKPSQLRLHMNVHYMERPFKCDSCSVSFRTKGHLQKHERSASHHNKLSTSPATSSSEPRPFKCSDCNIAFRIHGHLAKHLRSKMHIMKLECLAKIPFGLYAELERSNSLLTEINTADGEQCLESLKALAQKVFMNDPGKLKNMADSPDLLEME